MDKKEKKNENKLSDIVNAIGKAENLVSLNDILKAADREGLTLSKLNQQRIKLSAAKTACKLSCIFINFYGIIYS